MPRPSRCAVWDRTFPNGPPALGHAGMVPPVAAREEGPLCRPVDCNLGPPAGRPRPGREAPVSGVGGQDAERRHHVCQGSRPCRSHARRARRRHGRICGGPNGLHALSDSNGSCPSARSAHWFWGMCVCLWVHIWTFWVNFCGRTFNFSMAGVRMKSEELISTSKNQKNHHKIECCPVHFFEGDGRCRECHGRAAHARVLA